MKKINRTLGLGLCTVAAAFCVGGTLVGCTGSTNFATIRFNLILEMLESLVLGNDAYSWNILCVDPEGSFGYVREEEPAWYSYNRIKKSDIPEIADAFESLYAELININVKKLSGTDVAKYNSLEYFLQTYVKYYGSPYAYEFTLFGGDYISSEGGYVADFASCFENYAFRTERDVKDLLAITKSTKTAFASYVDFVEVRAEAGYPLYDYTISGMQEYLNAITEKGDDYYLYEYSEHKIDKAEFLSENEKTVYKERYADALTKNFMQGVSDLYVELEEYKGNVSTVEEGYLAAYGNAGKAYYEWLFYSKTGIESKTAENAFYETLTAYLNYDRQFETLKNNINEYEATDPELYEEINAYINGEKAVLDLSKPDDMMNYLKGAAKAIVPDLKTMPEIDFKLMDETVAEISNTNAYYLQSPVDDMNAVEHVTINPRLIDANPGELLFTIAHEGYPGHLYASVNAKEDGFRIMGRVSSCTAFGEGWANYAALTVFENIAAATEDKALATYCEYMYLYNVSGYLNSVLLDFQINYLGSSVNDFVGEPALGETDEEYAERVESVRNMVGRIMEIPAVYIPYGYGMYVLIDIHDTAREKLGSKYNEVEFNGRLLAEGMAPTLDRAKEITSEYIKAAK